MLKARKPLLIWHTIALCLIGAAAAPGQAPTNRESDEAAIRAASSGYLSAMKQGDTDSLRQMWTADGDYVDCAGQKFNAQDLIRKQPANASKTAAADAPPTKSTVRFVTTDVAIEDGTISDGSAICGRFSAVWVKQGGRWKLSSLRESATSDHKSGVELDDLAWLLGEWTGATDNGAVAVSSQRSADGNYIDRDFLARSDGREDVTAAQRIGWDASTGKIRCWTSDSQGNASEGTWRRNGDRWIVESIDTSADGKQSKSTAVYIPLGDGRFATEVSSDWNGDGQRADTKVKPLRVEFKRALEK